MWKITISNCNVDEMRWMLFILFYCSKEYQTKMWVDWQHMGECHYYLRILQKYIKPFAKNIRQDIEVHGIAPNLASFVKTASRLSKIAG